MIFETAADSPFWLQIGMLVLALRPDLRQFFEDLLAVNVSKATRCGYRLPREQQLDWHYGSSPFSTTAVLRVSAVVPSGALRVFACT